jgi:purine-binding chemotaxis protein CheW
VAEKQYIIFNLNNEKFATSINHIASISEYSSITPVPNGPSYVDGLLNLRGDIIPVINLKKRFKMADSQMKEKRIIIANKNDVQIGFLVDDASQSMSVDESLILPPPKIIVKKNNDYISEICIHNNELIIVIDLDHILSDDEIDELLDMS